MSEIPNNLKYSKTHEWVEEMDDGSVRIGITDHAQDLLGDMVFVELPEVGHTLGAGDECAVVESVKAASDVYSPLSGEVLEVNEALTEQPELINSMPYEDGWIFRLAMSNPSELNSLLDADAYQNAASDEDH